jgi:hypothetical protein
MSFKFMVFVPLTHIVVTALRQTAAFLSPGIPWA